MSICYPKGAYGSVHENTSVCAISETPIQRIGLTNCEQNRHLCYAPPCNPIPIFGYLTDTNDRYRNDSLYWLFDFPTIGGDNYVLEKYNPTLQVWNTVVTLDNTQGVKYTFGDAIFNDKYENRSGYRLDAHRILSLGYGEGKYRFLVENTTTYEESLFSTCFCIMNWSCELAKGTVKVYTNFTGVISDWKNPVVEADHNINCMVWTDSRRYLGTFKLDSYTITDTIFVTYDRPKKLHKSNTVPNYKLEFNEITREAYPRLFNYGRHSRDIFITDYNEDIIGYSQHWTAVTMPNPPTTDESPEIPIINLVTLICEEKRDLVFNKCISCEPPPEPAEFPPVIPDPPINPKAVMIVNIDTTSFDSGAANRAEGYAMTYANDFRTKYPGWTGALENNKKGCGDTSFEQWLDWGRLYAKNKGHKDVVMINFIDETHDVYNGIEPIVSTNYTAQYEIDYNGHVDNYDNYFDSFQAMLYMIPTGDSNEVPADNNPNGYPLRNWYVNSQNTGQCAYHGEIIPYSEFIPSYQDTTNQLEIILTENNYSALGLGLKHYGYYEKHDFPNGFNDLTYQQFKADIDVMMDP